MTDDEIISLWVGCKHPYPEKANCKQVTCVLDCLNIHECEFMLRPYSEDSRLWTPELYEQIEAQGLNEDYQHQLYIEMWDDSPRRGRHAIQLGSQTLWMLLTAPEQHRAAALARAIRRDVI